MPKILIVEKLGNLKGAILAPGVTPGTDLYKKAGFKVATDFALRHTYDFAPAAGVSYQVELYGKTKGRAGQENKYDFPPPMDETLFFGSCVLVCRDMGAAGAVIDLTAADWEKIYEHLFGGFEDLGDADSDGDDDSEEAALEAEERRLRQDPNTQFTKEGYVKDDFIVDDDDDELLEDDDSETELDDSDSEVSLDDDDVSDETPPASKKRAAGAAGAAAGARKRGGAAGGGAGTAPVAMVTRARAPAAKRPPATKTGSAGGAKPKRGAAVEEPAPTSEPVTELEEEAYFA